MRRIWLVLLLLPLTLASAAAFDFGGYLDNTSGFARAPAGVETTLRLVQRTTVALWAEQKLGAWTLAGQGSYTYTPNVPLLFDLDRLTLGTEVPATAAGATAFGLSLGRSHFTDPTGLVLSHTLDGLRLRVSRMQSTFRFAIGTTALLQKPTNRIILSRLDELDLADPERRFAPPRLIAVVDYEWLEAFAGQQVTLGATVQEDLRPADQLTPAGTEATTPDPEAGGRLDTQYVSLVVSGAVAPGVFQRTYYTLNSGRQLVFAVDDRSSTGFSYQYETLLGHLAGTEITWFLPEVLNSRARLFGQFSTGDTEWSDSFVPISPSAFSDVFTLQPGNSSHLGISYSVRPLAGRRSDVLQTELSTVAYFRSSGSGAVSVAAVDPTTDGSYAGTDVNLTVTAVPFSDLRLVLKGGLFAPNKDVMGPENKNVEYQVTLQGVLRF